MEKRDETSVRQTGVKRTAFLKDVLLCSLSAYGGPESHLGVFMNRMVTKRKYLTEEELVELLALCSILPGPTSTQTIVSIGYKKGGPVLALLTMLVWGLPVITVMAVLSFLYRFLENLNVSQDVLRFIGPMAVGFILVAAVRISRKVIKDLPTVLLMIFGGITTFFIRSPWIFPAVLVFGGAVSVLLQKEKNIWNRIKVHPPWIYLIVFAALALGSIVLTQFTDFLLLNLFEEFYRYGYLVFGGGQVVVPVMYSELVDIKHLMTGGEFLTGYGLVQGLPGPMFSFAAYAGGLAARGSGTGTQIIGAILGAVGIFLPGLLLIYFVFPLWEELKQIKAIRLSLKGINAVAGGLISAAAVILLLENGLTPVNLAIAGGTAVLLAFTKVPAPLIVAAVIGAGFLF